MTTQQFFFLCAVILRAAYIIAHVPYQEGTGIVSLYRELIDQFNAVTPVQR